MKECAAVGSRGVGPGRRLILASASPRRHELFERLGVPFEIIEPQGVDESAARGSAPEIARFLALKKAEHVVQGLLGRPSPGAAPGWVVLGADTVVAFGEGARETALGKPRDQEDARRMLRLLSGRTHQVWTGIAVAQPGIPTLVGEERSDVTFRHLPEDLIEEYLRSAEPMGKAGAYAIQGRGEALVESFMGCFYNIVGLPLVLVARLLGDRVLGDWYVVPKCDCGRHRLQRGRPGCGQP